MAVTVQIEKTLRLVVVIFSGEVTFDDLRAVRMTQGSADFEPDFSQLSGFSRDVTLPFTNDEFRRYVSAPAMYSRHARRAIVARSPAVYGMARIFQVYKESSAGDIQVFDNLAAALQFLNIEPEGLVRMVPAVMQLDN